MHLAYLKGNLALWISKEALGPGLLLMCWSSGRISWMSSGSVVICYDLGLIIEYSEVQGIRSVSRTILSDSPTANQVNTLKPITQQLLRILHSSSVLHRSAPHSLPKPSLTTPLPSQPARESCSPNKPDKIPSSNHFLPSPFWLSQPTQPNNRICMSLCQTFFYSAAEKERDLH